MIYINTNQSYYYYNSVGTKVPLVSSQSCLPSSFEVVKYLLLELPLHLGRAGRATDGGFVRSHIVRSLVPQVGEDLFPELLLDVLALLLRRHVAQNLPLKLAPDPFLVENISK